MSARPRPQRPGPALPPGPAHARAAGLRPGRLQRRDSATSSTLPARAHRRRVSGGLSRLQGHTARVRAKTNPRCTVIGPADSDWLVIGPVGWASARRSSCSVLSPACDRRRGLVLCGILAGVLSRAARWSRHHSRGSCAPVAVSSGGGPVGGTGVRLPGRQDFHLARRWLVIPPGAPGTASAARLSGPASTRPRSPPRSLPGQ